VASEERRVAIVTGASRGVGKGISLQLAKAGYDIALLARSLTEGEEREHSSTLRESNTRPLPGSLQTTAALVEQLGRAALPVVVDLSERRSIEHAVATVLDSWGRVDALVNNARFVGPGHMDLFSDTPLEVIEPHFAVNFFAPLALIKATLPNMLERGSGSIVDITSHVAYKQPTTPAGKGGSGLAYATSKGALHRIVPVLAVEHRDSGVRFFNVDPGLVTTERITIEMAQFGISLDNRAPAELIGAVIAWLVTSPEADELSGAEVIDAQRLNREHAIFEVVAEA
jgi:NAD(P)-dependent dehydrogenase (short-subunit alcohol dehydrogenase family)